MKKYRDITGVKKQRRPASSNRPLPGITVNHGAEWLCLDELLRMLRQQRNQPSVDITHVGERATVLPRQQGKGPAERQRLVLNAAHQGLSGQIVTRGFMLRMNLFGYLRGKQPPPGRHQGGIEIDTRQFLQWDIKI